MRLKRLIVVSLAATTVATSVHASAASLGGISGGVAAGDSAIPVCDADGVVLGYATSGGKVTAVTVGDLADPACEGGELSLILTDADGGSIASGGPYVIPGDGDTAANAVTIPVAPKPAAADVRGYHVAIVGP